jgi:predicted nucleotidyltransferase
MGTDHWRPDGLSNLLKPFPIPHAAPFAERQRNSGIRMNRPKSGFTLSDVKSALQPYGAERIYVFGSWARGAQDELSDLDVVVIKNTRKPFFHRLREVSALLPRDFGAVDILVYTPDEFAKMCDDGNAFAEMVLEEGLIL